MAKLMLKGSKIDWQPGPFPKTRIKPYPPAKDGKTFSIVMELAPGGRLERHREPFNEVNFVLSGSVEVEGQLLVPGDYLYTAAGEEHGPYQSPDGCTVLITKFSS